MKRTKKGSKVKNLARQVKASPDKKKGQQEEKLLLAPTGATLLNLACSDHFEGGWGVGKIVNVIGDSSSGKTMLAFTMFAEVVRRKEFNEYHLIYDDVEQALEFDLERLFGKRMADRIEAPAYDEEGVPIHSDLIQDFFAYIQKALDRKEPFIYVLDSFDALSSKQEVDKVDKTLKAHLKGEKEAGSYNMDKPKLASQILRMIKSKIKNTESLVVIISQTRDNINPMSFEKKTRSGGRALKFYCSHEIWLAMAGQIKSKGRVIGANVKAKVTKNKITGKRREVAFPVYYDYGVDSITSEINFLVEENHWQKSGNKIIAPEFDFKGSQRLLIRKIEEEAREEELSRIVGEVWGEIEESLKLRRKGKYD